MDQTGDSDVAVARRKQFQERAPKYLEMLFAIVLRMTGNHELSREIAQQAIFKYFVRMEAEKWQQDVRKEPGYLAQTARNLVNDGWRAYGRGETSLDELLEGGSVPDQIKCFFDLEKPIYLEQLREQIPLKTILNGFSEYQLRLLMLREVEGLSHKEIAHEVNENVAVVRYELQKIKATIRARVRKIFGKKSFFKSDT